MGSRLQCNSLYHLETNGQTKVVNRSLGNLMRNLIGDKQSQWDLVVAQVEFSYNNSMDRSIGKIPY
jgi:hypothetical protein